ncbi:AraC family transcriptional regulator [Enterovibrio baiacu]|uniref:AraC family transcriptional regulator n=1 Tax=Enterovibrio baiacu TaxID=2491023 RepID=UPI0010133CB5|nr:AraC family transcriptional regulator [Enterovibrio baiacu]MBE1273594.1 helix-turn-helix domain-containing protein [Enterovibrio baiacu]
MSEKCIPVERMRSELALAELHILRISSLYDSRGIHDVSRPHRLNFSALIYITEGEGVHYIDHQRYVIRAGTLLTLGRNQIHSFAKDRSVDGYVLPFNCTFLSSASNDPYFDVMIAALSHINCLPNASDDIDSLFNTLAEAFTSTSEFNVEIIRSLLRCIMLKSVVPAFKAQYEAAPPTVSSSEFYRLKQYVDRHFNDRPSSSDIALALGKSIKQLDKLAKSHAGESVKELVDGRVLLEAKRLLAFSQYSIADIAAQLGFNEATNMTKFFKRHTEVSPKDFRQLCRMGLRQK